MLNVGVQCACIECVWSFNFSLVYFCNSAGLEKHPFRLLLKIHSLLQCNKFKQTHTNSHCATLGRFACFFFYLAWFCFSRSIIVMFLISMCSFKASKHKIVHLHWNGRQQQHTMCSVYNLQCTQLYRNSYISFCMCE